MLCRSSGVLTYAFTSLVIFQFQLIIFIYKRKIDIDNLIILSKCLNGHINGFFFFFLYMYLPTLIYLK